MKEFVTTHPGFAAFCIVYALAASVIFAVIIYKFSWAAYDAMRDDTTICDDENYWH